MSSGLWAGSMIETGCDAQTVLGSSGSSIALTDLSSPAAGLSSLELVSWQLSSIGLASWSASESKKDL